MGSFLFWLIWPYLVAKITTNIYTIWTGKTPSPRSKTMHRELARVMRDMIHPLSPAAKK